MTPKDLTCVAYSPDGALLAAAARGEYRVLLYDVAFPPSREPGR
jgi:hypothetical protein